MYNRTVESTCTLKSESVGIKRPRMRKKRGLKRGSNAIKKSEKNSRRRNVLHSPGKIEVMIPVSLAVASTAGASTGASSTHDVFTVKMEDDGPLTTLSRSLSGQNTTSDL